MSKEPTLSCFLLQMGAVCFSHVDMCISVYGYMHMSALGLKESFDFPRAGVIGGCEPLSVGAEKWTWLFVGAVCALRR